MTQQGVASSTPASLLDDIGNTPLTRLSRLTQGLPVALFAKREAANPGGSIKDRVAKTLILSALASGHLTADRQLVEPTSGNTGIGMAMVCASLGIGITLTMPESMSAERRALLKALGAHIVLTPAHLGMMGSIAEAKRLVNTHGYVLLDQFSNPDTVKAHYTSTGPEIWAQAGHVDAFIAGVGTGGTLMGVGRYLRERNPKVRLIAVEPAESPVLSGGVAGPHIIQGIGAGFVPALVERPFIDEVLTVTGTQATVTARRLGREEGLLSGISSGANVFAALFVAARPEFCGKRLVTVLPDSGERYLSTALFE